MTTPRTHTGSSHVLSIGPTAINSLIYGTILGNVIQGLPSDNNPNNTHFPDLQNLYNQFGSKVAFMMGWGFLIIGFLRLGFLTNFLRRGPASAALGDPSATHLPLLCLQHGCHQRLVHCSSRPRDPVPAEMVLWIQHQPGTDSAGKWGCGVSCVPPSLGCGPLPWRKANLASIPQAFMSNIISGIHLFDWKPFLAGACFLGFLLTIRQVGPGARAALLPL